MNKAEALARLRLTNGDEIIFSRCDTTTTYIQTVLQCEHRRVLDCLCGAGLRVKITLDPTGRWYMPRALSNEVELHAPTCGAVTVKRIASGAVETQQQTSEFETAFAKAYAAQIAGRVTNTAMFCECLLNNIRNDKVGLAAGTLLNYEFEPNGNSLNIAFAGTVLDTKTGILKPTTLLASRGAPFGGRIEAFGHGIKGSYVWAGYITSTQPPTLRSIHVWPVATVNDQVHAVHSANERIFAIELEKLGVLFAKPPTEKFLREWVCRDNILCGLLPITPLWPDFVVRFGERVCLVELGGIRDWRYMVRLLEKEREYGQIEKAYPGFEWAVIWPDATSRKYEMVSGSPGNLMEKYFPYKKSVPYTADSSSLDCILKSFAVENGSPRPGPSLGSTPPSNF